MREVERRFCKLARCPHHAAAILFQNSKKSKSKPQGRERGRTLLFEEHNSSHTCVRGLVIDLIWNEACHAGMSKDDGRFAFDREIVHMFIYVYVYKCPG